MCKSVADDRLIRLLLSILYGGLIVEPIEAGKVFHCIRYSLATHEGDLIRYTCNYAVEDFTIPDLGNRRGKVLTYLEINS